MEEHPMSNTRYSAEHEWARSDDGRTATIGITDYAQEQLGDIVFVELPNVGDAFAAGDEIAVIESVKAADGLKTPVSGTVIEINQDLVDTPETVNESPIDNGWFCKLELTDAAELEGLMDHEQYREYTSNLE